MDRECEARIKLEDWKSMYVGLCSLRLSFEGKRVNQRLSKAMIDRKAGREEKKMDKGRY